MAATTTTSPRQALEARIADAQATIEAPQSIVGIAAQLNTTAPVVMLINGKPVEPSIVQTTLSNGYIVSSDDFSLLIQTFTEVGSATVIDPSGRLVVERSGRLQIDGGGFAPTSKVRVWAFSEPINLVDLFADDQGKIAGVSPIPAELPLGIHTVQLNGVSPTGDVRSLNFGLRVVEQSLTETNEGADSDDPSDVSTTESGDIRAGDFATWFWWILAIVATIVALATRKVMLGRRSRESTSLEK